MQWIGVAIGRQASDMGCVDHRSGIMGAVGNHQSCDEMIELIEVQLSGRWIHRNTTDGCHVVQYAIFELSQVEWMGAARRSRARFVQPLTNFVQQGKQPPFWRRSA